MNNKPPPTITEKFHQWLNDCPTKIEDYQDNIDSVTIRFDTPFTEEN